LAKTFGWDLDYIGKLPIKNTMILIECINLEIEKQEIELKKREMRLRRKW